MKNLQTYESFLFEESPVFGYDGCQLQVGKSVISRDGFSGIIVSKESVNGKVQYRDHHGVIRVCESLDLVEFDPINEDLTWWEVTKGILAADAIKVGLGFAGGGILLAGSLFVHWRSSIANKIENIKQDKRYAAIKDQAAKIADKFNGDKDLDLLISDLQRYPYIDTSFLKGVKATKTAKETNATRNKLMREISKYVKSKLTSEETEFFTEINKILRDKPLTDEKGKTIEEDVVSDSSRTIGTGTYTSTTSDSNYMVGGSRDTTDPSSGGSTFFS